MRSLNLSAGPRNCCCCCGVKKLTIFDPSHFNVKRGCGEIPRDLSQKSVTLTWQQRDNSLSQLPLNITGALSASHEEDHFADSPWYYCDQGWGPWHWHQTMWETARREKDCCRVFENLDQEIDDDKGFFYWEVTPNIKDDADDQLWLKDWPPLIFSRCFNKWLVPGGGEINPPT